MATIKHHTSNAVHILDSSHRVGRDPTCQLRLTSPQSSWEHALISWTGQGWEIRDLGTVNGTTVDDHRLEPRDNVPLNPGTTLVFGAPEEQYRVQDIDPPQARALAEGCASVYAEDGVLCLPDADHYEYMIREDSPGRWQIESQDGQLRSIVDSARVACAGRTYTLHLPFIRERTWRAHEGALKLAECRLHFQVTADEELVLVRLVARGELIELPPRSHGHLLLLLARQLQSDLRKGVPAKARGWVNRQVLPDLLGVKSHNAINVAICRARNQIRQAGVIDGKHVIESSGRDARKVRLSVSEISIEES